MSTQKKIKVKKGTIDFSFNRSDLVEAKEASNGIVFMLKGGIMIVADDSEMPTHTKVNIIGALDRFPNSNVIIDLLKYNQPASLEID